MIYPQKITSRKSDLIINILLVISIIVALVLILINKLTTPDIHWAAVANCGIIYIWLTVIYSIKRSDNVAGHVLIQTILISIVTIYLDKTLGWKAWSVYIANPVILIIANITMLILTAISYEKYIKYAIYQLIIVLISFTPMILIMKNIIELKALNRIAIEISVLNFLISLIFCYKDIKDAITRKIHM